MRSTATLAVAALLLAPSAFAQEEPPADTPVTPLPPPPAPPPPPPPPSVDVELLPPPPPPFLPRRGRARLFGFLEGGYAYTSLYGVSMNGANVSGVLGAQFRTWTIGGRLDGSPARTEGGLTTFGLFVGPDIEARVDRFRIGGGPRIGSFTVDRATDSTSIWTACFGIVGRLSFDVFQLDDEGNGAIFFVAKTSVDVLPGALYSVGLGAGARF